MQKTIKKKETKLWRCHAIVIVMIKLTMQSHLTKEKMVMIVSKILWQRKEFSLVEILIN